MREGLLSLRTLYSTTSDLSSAQELATVSPPTPTAITIMQVYKTILSHPSDTHQLGHWLGAACRLPLFIGLNGNLGAGKTALSKGFAEGFGITENITSPTYNLLNVYDSPRGTLYHLDIYRLHDIEEVFDLGIEEAMETPAVILMEWKNKFKTWPLAIPQIELELSHLPAGRACTLTGENLSQCFQRPLSEMFDN